MIDRLDPVFVSAAPDTLEPGVLYVSVDYRTTLHLCACGCGSEVVAPIRSNGWSFSFNGESVSLKPSIGNWGLACRSHYWIRDGRVCWVGDTEPEPRRRLSFIRVTSAVGRILKALKWQ